MDENKVENAEEQEEKKESKLKRFLNKKVSVKEILGVLVAPVCALAGVCYTANKRVEEKEIDLEIERLKADNAEKLERIRGGWNIEVEKIKAQSRLDQLDKITEGDSETLPDKFALDLMKSNNSTT